MIRQLLALLTSVLPLSSVALPGEGAAVWTGSVEIPDGTTLEFSVELQEHSGTITIPMQHVKDMLLSDVTATDRELRFSIPSAGAVWELKVAEDGKSASGVLRQGAVLKTTMKRLEPGQEAPTLARPQEPQPPFPYETLEVTFESQPAEVVLSGTLSLPRGSGPFPCVVLVSGSGPQDRDESLAGHRPFLVIADHLTRHGIAVLRYDDRGVGRSTGAFDGATTEDFAQDALAAVAFLLSREDVDAKSIGIVGHSEGALVAPICAARSEAVAFIVLLAGPGVRGAELLPLQSRLIALAQGMPAADAELMAKESAAIYALMLAGTSDAELKEAIRAAILRQLAVAPQTKGLPAEELAKQVEQLVAAQTEELFSPWIRMFLALDPCESLAQVSCPVLALNGEKDLQVPPKENLPPIERALEQAGNEDVTILELPGLNHLFQTCGTGAPTEYAQIEETFSPAALEVMTSWIRKRSGLD